MDKETLKKIIGVLCEVAERVDMSEDEEKYYDMAIGILSVMAK